MNSVEELLIAESTKVDFKVALEEKKPKSWLNSINSSRNITRSSDSAGYSGVWECIPTVITIT